MLYLMVVLIVLVIIISISRIYISFSFKQIDSMQTVTFNIYFYRIRLYKKKIKRSINSLFEEDISKGFENIYKKMNGIFKSSIKSKRLVTTLFHRSSCKELKWHTYIGTGEAATTGIIIGSLWALKGMVTGFISGQCQMSHKPIITITPHFQQRYFNTEFTCMFSIKVGQTIYIILKELKNS